MIGLKRLLTAVCAVGCLVVAEPAAAFVAGPIKLDGIARSDVTLVASKYYARKAAARASTSRYYARKSAARLSVKRTAVRRAAYKDQTRRYQLRRDNQKLLAKKEAAKKERARTRYRVRRGLGY